jgi:alginate O-acetyltransferase complex protein AlgI
MGIIAYSFQLYFDFSGYSDMACGLGNMLGFEFLKNFDYPYISKSITEFWRRWHISLSIWFKEYVYIPLGGNRKGKKRWLLNLLIVWFLTGLWHGANWNYILWGLYFGLILVAEKLFLLKVLEKLPSILKYVYSSLLIILGWVIFYFEKTEELFAYFLDLFSLNNGIVSTNACGTILQFIPLFAICFIASTPIASKFYFKIKNHKFYWLAETLVLTALMLLCTASLVKQSYNPFLYFRF